MKSTLFSACLTLLFGLIAVPAQVTAESGGTTSVGFSQAELDQMMAPVALYPDSLLSQVLMAATYPDQVAQAAAWSKAHKGQEGDAAVKAVESKGWDPSVASLVAFPQVLDIMGEKPDWVRQMGEAFLADPDAVMDSVQHLRSKAREQGNLETTEQQKVIVEQAPQQTTIIKIEPADPQVIYVPTYNPTVVYGTWWWPAYPPFYYYPPAYYYPPGYGIAAGLATGIAFGIGIGITNAIWGGFDWRRRDVNINVNRYNRINVNNRLHVNNKHVSWKERNVKRRDRARADLRDRNRTGNRPVGLDRRNDFRGRDAERERARQTLKGKGMDPAAERKKLSGKGGEQVRDRVSKIDRERKVGSGGQRDKATARQRDVSRKAEPKRDLSAAQTKRSGDNAFKGLGETRKSGLDIERGRQSNRSFERNIGSGGFGGRGGGGGFSGHSGGGGFGGRGGGGGGHFRGR